MGLELGGVGRQGCVAVPRWGGGWGFPPPLLLSLLFLLLLLLPNADPSSVSASVDSGPGLGNANGSILGRALQFQDEIQQEVASLAPPYAHTLTAPHPTGQPPPPSSPSSSSSSAATAQSSASAPAEAAPSPSLTPGQRFQRLPEEDKAALIGQLSQKLVEEWEVAYPFLHSRTPSDMRRGQVYPTEPRPPHLEDCGHLKLLRRRVDRRQADGARPLWSLMGTAAAWGQGLGNHAQVEAQGPLLHDGELQEEMLLRASRAYLGPYPPWVVGADEDNLVLTRKVQRDLWVHQHPRNCSAPGLRFMIVNITNDFRGTEKEVLYLGVGAQLGVLAQLLAEAVKRSRILVIHYFKKADHDGCPGSQRGRWSCYFAPETTAACRKRAFQVVEEQRQARIPQDLENSQAYEWGRRQFLYWGGSPSCWGAPWEHTTPNIDFSDHLVGPTDDDNHSWFRSQAIRYLLRYPSTRLCHLVNRERHAAFGREAANATAEAMLVQGKDAVLRGEGGASVQDAPLMPFWQRLGLFQGRGGGPLVAMHVRQGDKGREMQIRPFSDYMDLAHKLRLHFPAARSIWIITEMQSVVEEAMEYPGWHFYFTRVHRQGKGVQVSQYEQQMGMGESTDNALVNLLIASSCDFFIATMGSTFSLIINDLRRTGGRIASGVLTANRDRRWMSAEERASLGLW